MFTIWKYMNIAVPAALKRRRLRQSMQHPSSRLTP
jgi:hypothetical protein